MNKPKTYNEIVRMKKCYILSQYFSNITENVFNDVYDFLGKSQDNTVVANKDVLYFIDSTNQVVKSLPVTPKNLSFDSIKISDRETNIVSKFESSTGRSSSSGSSTINNNNNNNNNNNR